MPMKVVFADIDGTLLHTNQTISDKNLNAIDKIKRNNAKLVLVTGRNLYSTQKVLSDTLDIDFLVFSTGVAISNFKTKEIITSHFINSTDTKAIIKMLTDLKLNFFVHHPVPNNHYFYFNFAYHDYDFLDRFELYNDFAKPMNTLSANFNASQFVIVLPYDFDYFEKIRNKISSKFQFLSYVRATSPLDHKHIWLEIYPHGISKGSAVKELCNILNVDLSDTFSVGNDYNDESMLEITGKSFVVDNAPPELKEKFPVVASNDDDGFAEAIDIIFDE